MDALSPTLLMYGTLFGALGTALALKTWGRRQGRTSLHGSDASLNDVAISFIGSLWDSPPDKVIGGKQVWRSTLGARLIVPPILFFFLIMGYGTFVAQASPSEDHTMSQIVFAGAGLVLAYQWFMLLFIWRIEIDGGEIRSYGFSLKPQLRKMDEITDIATHPEKKLLMISFANAGPIYAPRFITGRAEFSELIETRIKRNCAAKP